MWAAFLYVEWDRRLFAFPFGGIVEDFECAGVTELLFDVAYETHLGVFIVENTLLKIRRRFDGGSPFVRSL